MFVSTSPNLVYKHYILFEDLTTTHNHTYFYILSSHGGRKESKFWVTTSQSSNSILVRTNDGYFRTLKLVEIVLENWVDTWSFIPHSLPRTLFTSVSNPDLFSYLYHIDFNHFILNIYFFPCWSRIKVKLMFRTYRKVV